MASTGRISKYFGHFLLNNTLNNVKSQVLPSCSMVNRRHYPATRNLPKAQYGGRHTVSLMAGDGVGPELMMHVKEVFRYAGAPIDFEEVRLDHSVSDDEYDRAILSIKRNGVAIKGNVENYYSDPGFQSRNVELRTELDLFANIIRMRSVPGVEARHGNIDVVVIRENTEGEYSGLEHEVQHENVGGVVESLKIITATKSLRIARYAFEYARNNDRKKVTCVHKANIMKLADGLFLECCRQVAKEYPDIEFQDMIVDNTSMQMVSRPQQFDVMVMPNLYGNIIANIGVGLVGGSGLVPGVNIGENMAVFEMGTRLTGKKIAGKNIANPSAMLLASADMLHFLGLDSHSRLISNAVYSVLAEGEYHTPDIGGSSSTTDVVSAIVRHIKSQTAW